MLNIKEASEYLNVSKLTLRNWEKNGLIKPFKTTGKHRRYLTEDLDNLIGKTKKIQEKQIICYCRVSTSEQKYDLERQIQNVSTFCISKGYTFRVISDIGSGLNYNKKGFKELIKLIINKEISKIVVNYKDRLIRFGIEIIEQLCELNDVELVVINNTETKSYEEELVDDVLSIITVFSSKLYGSRSHKAKKIVDDNKKEFLISDSSN